MRVWLPGSTTSHHRSTTPGTRDKLACRCLGGVEVTSRDTVRRSVNRGTADATAPVTKLHRSAASGFGLAV